MMETVPDQNNLKYKTFLLHGCLLHTQRIELGEECC